MNKMHTLFGEPVNRIVAKDKNERVIAEIQNGKRKTWAFLGKGALFGDGVEQAYAAAPDIADYVPGPDDLDPEEE